MRMGHTTGKAEGRLGKGLFSPAAPGRSLPVMVTKRAGQVRCDDWSGRMQTGGQVSAITYVGRMGVAGHAYERRLAVKEAPTKPSTPIWPMPTPRKFWWSRASASPLNGGSQRPIPLPSPVR